MVEVKYYQAAKYGGDCAFCAKKIEKNEPCWFAAGNIYCTDHTAPVVQEHATEHPKAQKGAAPVDLKPIVDALGKIEFQLQEMRTIMRSQGAK